MYTNRVFGTVKCVLFIEVSSFRGVRLPLYNACTNVILYIHVYIGIQHCSRLC